MQAVNVCFCFVFVLLGVVGLSLDSAHVAIVKTVELVDRIEMRKTDCFGEARLVPHVPSSS